MYHSWVFLKVCADRFYGGDCDNACGHCKTIQPVCEKTEGNCSAGCQQGWQEPNCDGNWIELNINGEKINKSCFLQYVDLCINLCFSTFLHPYEILLEQLVSNLFHKLRIQNDHKTTIISNRIYLSK